MTKDEFIVNIQTAFNRGYFPKRMIEEMWDEARNSGFTLGHKEGYAEGYVDGINKRERPLYD